MITETQRSRGLTHARTAAAAGGLLGAIAASSCCILPLALFTFGAGGPWIANLTRLAPYQPYFLTVSAACLGLGYWFVYRSSRVRCVAREICGSSTANKFVKSALVFSTLLVVAAIAFNLFAQLLNS